MRKEGAVCIATSYTQTAQLLYPPKRSREGQAGSASLWLTPPRAAVALPVLYRHLRSREDGIQRDRCWAKPYHTVVGKAEKRGQDVEQVGEKKTHRAR